MERLRYKEALLVKPPGERVLDLCHLHRVSLRGLDLERVFGLVFFGGCRQGDLVPTLAYCAECFHARAGRAEVRSTLPDPTPAAPRSIECDSEP